HGEGLVLPIHQDDGPPARCALYHPGAGRRIPVQAPEASFAASSAEDAQGEYVVAAPVQRLGGDPVAAICLRGAPVAGRKVSSLAHLHAVQEGFVRVRDLAELEICPRGGDEWRQREARSVPANPGV